MSGVRLIGRLIALLIIFIFVTVTPMLILAYNAQQIALNGDFLDELFEETDLFEAAIPEMADDLAREIRSNRETRDTPVARLSADDWEQIIHAVAPPETMQDWAQDAVEGWRDWVRRGGRLLGQVVMPFGELRDNIVDDPQQTVLRTLTEAQPECSDGQEPLGGRDDLIPQCRPSAAGLAEFYQRVAERWRERPREVWRQLMPDEIARYPDDISLANFIEEESGSTWDARVSWRATRLGLRAARWLLAAFIAVQCVFALALVALFAARNWREALRWVGTPLLLAGLFTLVLAFLFLVGGEVGTLFIPDEEVPIGVQEIIDDTARAFAGDLWPPTAWQGGVLLLVGLGMWVLSYFVPGVRALAPAPVTIPKAPEETATPVETTPVVPLESEAVVPGDTPSPETGESEATAAEEINDTDTDGIKPPIDTA
jgi:hypothetical protein